MQLKTPELLRKQCYVNGKWVETQQTFSISNPSTQEKIAEVPNMGAEETKGAIEAASRAFPSWKAKTVTERSALLRKWHDLIQEHAEDLAAIMTMEQGKPLMEAALEIRYGASFIEWFAEEAKRVYGDIIPSPLPNQHLLVIKQPIGPVAAITPWNFPMAMIARKCAVALAVGCTMVLKPAEATPLSALALAELAHRAGFPPGVLNVITGKPEIIGAEMTRNPLIKKISFTGSTRVGKLLMAQSANTVKKLSLELGGNAPCLVFSDAKMQTAVQGVMMAKFRNTGQTCIAANRILVEDAIFDPFAKALVGEVSALKVGDGFTPGVQIGPLITEAAVQKVERHVKDAIAKGAKLLCGGKRHKLGKTFYEPTVLSEVTSSMEITQEETFGPILPLMRFHQEEEAIRIANDTAYGLASYLFTQNLDRTWRICEALDFGMVSVNGGMFSNAVSPFGGLKESGMGREGSKYGIDDYLEMKYICITANL